ncbi:MAG: alpha/beta hydrolase [Ginsengibacter sp.]
MKKIFFPFLMFSIASAYCQQQSFRVEVSGVGQPVILIPGYSYSGDIWKETVDNLKAHYQLHVITIAGFAGVPAIDTPILKTVKSDLLKYVTDNHLNKPVLIGHSLGAFMCLWMASEEPSLFSKILCVDGVPFISAMMNPSITADQVKKNPAYNVGATNFKNIHQKEFADNQLKSLRTLLSDTTQTRLISQWTAAGDRKTLGFTFAEMASTDLRKAIATINIPVLILISSIGAREQSKKTLDQQYALLPDKRIIFPAGKHLGKYNNSLWFREQLKNFLVNGLAD